MANHRERSRTVASGRERLPMAIYRSFYEVTNGQNSNINSKSDKFYLSFFYTEHVNSSWAIISKKREKYGILKYNIQNNITELILCLLLVTDKAARSPFYSTSYSYMWDTSIYGWLLLKLVIKRLHPWSFIFIPPIPSSFKTP